MRALHSLQSAGCVTCLQPGLANRGPAQMAPGGVVPPRGEGVGQHLSGQGLVAGAAEQAGQGQHHGRAFLFRGQLHRQTQGDLGLFEALQGQLNLQHPSVCRRRLWRGLSPRRGGTQCSLTRSGAQGHIDGTFVQAFVTAFEGSVQKQGVARAWVALQHLQLAQQNLQQPFTGQGGGRGRGVWWCLAPSQPQAERECATPHALK